MHASAQYALAEVISGEFLISNRGDSTKIGLISNRGDSTKIGGVLRKSNCKYCSPANGLIFSRVKTEVSIVEEAIVKALTKGRSLLTIDVELVDDKGDSVSNYQFVWLIAEVQDG